MKRTWQLKSILFWRSQIVWLINMKSSFVNIGASNSCLTKVQKVLPGINYFFHPVKNNFCNYSKAFIFFFLKVWPNTNSLNKQFFLKKWNTFGFSKAWPTMILANNKPNGSKRSIYGTLSIQKRSVQAIWTGWDQDFAGATLTLGRGRITKRLREPLAKPYCIVIINIRSQKSTIYD